MDEIVRAELTIMEKSSGIDIGCDFEYSSIPDKFPGRQSTINSQQLETLVAGSTNILPPNMTSIWAGMEDPLSGPTNKIEKEAFEDCLKHTADAGSTLFLELGKKDKRLGKILQKIDELPDKSWLTIYTNHAFLPFEILTSEGYDQQATNELPEKERMWGYRFMINYVLLPEDDEMSNYNDLYKNHQNGDPFISFNLNPTIDKKFARDKFKPVEFQTDFYKKSIAGKGEMFKTGKEIRRQFTDCEQGSTLIYVYCHGASGKVEILELDAGYSIEPSSVTKRKSDFKRAPIVFLNSCESGSHSPAALNNFLSAFYEKKALGIIATVIQIPATFAATFGCRIVCDYLNGMPLGPAMLKLRRELLEKCNPLGLFYSLQCPAEISIPVSEVKI